MLRSGSGAQEPKGWASGKRADLRSRRTEETQLSSAAPTPAPAPGKPELWLLPVSGEQLRLREVGAQGCKTARWRNRPGRAKPEPHLSYSLHPHLCGPTSGCASSRRRPWTEAPPTWRAPTIPANRAAGAHPGPLLCGWQDPGALVYLPPSRRRSGHHLLPAPRPQGHDAELCLGLPPTLPCWGPSANRLPLCHLAS